jgi:threonine/homoserine/homoserine lactone efflux protein
MAITDWISLALVCMLGAFSPGPSLAVVFAVTRMNGRMSGLMSASGHGLAVLLYALVAATSLSYLIANYADVFFVLQALGALVLLWFGVRFIKAGFSKKIDNNIAAHNKGSGSVAKGLFGGFSSGFSIAAFNPQIAAFFLSLFSQFLNQEQSLYTHIGMAALAGVIDVGAYALYVMAFTTSFLGKAIDRYTNIIERLLGLILVLLGLSLISSYVI